MSTLSVFNFITLNGFYKGTNGDISWHQHGSAENSYAMRMLQKGNVLLFGRVTYEMMRSYWPTPFAKQNDPVLAGMMNNAEKLVFSKTLQAADWNNTTIVNNMLEEVIILKRSSNKDMTILGSGTIVTQLAAANLIDEYQIMIDPILLGSGTPILNNSTSNLHLQLVSATPFESGVVLLCYHPK